jgi:hypothetical protein
MTTFQQFFTIGEIEGLKAIKSPHDKELDDIKERILPGLRRLGKQAGDLAFRLGGNSDPIDFGEEWVITKAMFPGVVLHFAYKDIGDEFGDGKTDDLSILFSGEQVRLVPGEDLASYAELLAEYMGRLLAGMETDETVGGELSEMLMKALQDRAVALNMVAPDDFSSLGDFIGGFLHSNGATTLEVSPFPGITITIHWNEQQEFHVDFQGENAWIMSHFDLERLAVLSLNHVLRFVLISKGADIAPEICKKMFTPYGRNLYGI